MLKSALTISSLKTEIEKHVEIQHLLKLKVHSLERKAELPRPILGK